MTKEQSPISEGIFILGTLLALLIVGGVLGWSIRTVSSRDRLIIAQAEKSEALRAYYEAQTQAYINGLLELKKEPKTNGKKQQNQSRRS